jgi:hypothetical protein
LAWISQVTFLIAAGFAKISVLLFYRRLAAGTYSLKWKLATVIAICFTILYTIGFIIVFMCDCRPLEAYWRSYNLSYKTEYTCIDTTFLNPISGAISVLADFYSVLLPCVMLWHLECPRRQKIALNVIFCLGLVVVAAGSARTYYLDKIGRHYDIRSVILGQSLYRGCTLTMSQ